MPGTFSPFRNAKRTEDVNELKLFRIRNGTASVKEYTLV